MPQQKTHTHKTQKKTHTLSTPPPKKKNLVGGWTNPSEKNMQSQIGSSQVSPFGPAYSKVQSFNFTIQIFQLQ